MAEARELQHGFGRVVVAVYAGRWRQLLRQRRDGIRRTRAGELPPLTQPVLGTPGPVAQPQPRQRSTGREADPDGRMSANDPADGDAGGDTDALVQPDEPNNGGECPDVKHDMLHNHASGTTE